jgi:leucyl-tRNA synthetase
MITANKEILALTNRTNLEYNELLLKSLLFWTGKYTETVTEMQAVFVNKSIRNWFAYNYEKLEKEYLLIVKQYPTATKKDNERLYARIVGKIYEIYPSAILEAVKVPNNVYDINLN